MGQRCLKPQSDLMPSAQNSSDALLIGKVVQVDLVSEAIAKTDRRQIGTSVELSVYSDANAFEILAQEWNSVLQRAPINRIFYTWEWQKTWWEAYQPGELLLLTWRAGDDLVGIAPLFVADSMGMRRAQIIGCVDVTDYLDVIVDAAHLKPVYAAFSDFLAANRHRFRLARPV